MRSRAARRGCALLLLLAPGACGGDHALTPDRSQPVVTAPSSPTTSSATTVPRWDHVVVVVMSSRSYDEVIGSADAPFLNLLSRSGATFADAHAVAHPAAPNYFALFAGSTYGLTRDACPRDIRDANLATELVANHQTFASFAEGLPESGSRACRVEPYATAHNAPVAFANVATPSIRRAGTFPTDFTTLPTVSFVIPDLDDSMATDVRSGDTWLRTTIAAYAAWVTSHRSLLVVTWDQAQRGDADNHIPMVAIGAGVPVGHVDERVDHYALLATVQDAFGLARLANTVGAEPIAALGG